MLGITSGSDKNTFVIHFSDSAMVSRAISRGYITVNGIKIDLSDETKQELAEVDKKAEADRMRAFNEYVMQHELAVAKQQSESWEKAFQEYSKVIEIMGKMAKGGKERNENISGVEWSEFEWKTYETQMSVSIGKSVTIQGISEGENILN